MVSLSDFDVADELIEAKEDLVDPIKSFLNGPQAKIYDEAQALPDCKHGNPRLSPLPAVRISRGLSEDPQWFRWQLQMNQLESRNMTHSRGPGRRQGSSIPATT